MSNAALDYLRSIEFGARGEAGHTACPDCGAKPPLDPANPRDFELHGEDCRLAAAIAELKKLVRAAPKPEAKPEAKPEPRKATAAEETAIAATVKAEAKAGK